MCMVNRHLCFAEFFPCISRLLFALGKLIDAYWVWDSVRLKQSQYSPSLVVIAEHFM